MGEGGFLLEKGRGRNWGRVRVWSGSVIGVCAGPGSA